MKIMLFDEQGLHIIPPENIPARLSCETGILWADLAGPGEAETHLMADVFHFHPLAIEDTRNFQQRPKVEEYADYLFFILNPIHLKNRNPIFEELDVFVGRNYIVTVHPHEDDPVIVEARQRIERAGNALPISPSYLLYILVDTIVDGYFPLLDALEDEIDRLGDTILTHPRQEQLNRLFDLKTTLVTLWRVVWPQREILNRLLDHQMPIFEPEPIRHYLRDVADHVMWIADMVSTFRETLTGVMDLYMSAVSNRLNRVVNRLTVFTVLIGVLTVISGFYGMNFEHNWPPFAHELGALFVVGLMIGVTVGLLAVFRRLDWY